MSTYSLNSIEAHYHYQVVHEDGVVSHLVVPCKEHARVWDLAVRKHPSSPIRNLTLVRTVKPSPYEPPS